MSHCYYQPIRARPDPAPDDRNGRRIKQTTLNSTPRFREAVAERWFFTGLACSVIDAASAGFQPSLVNASAGRAPLFAVHWVAFQRGF
jgi:hypothetical protein